MSRRSFYLALVLAYLVIVGAITLTPGAEPSRPTLGWVPGLQIWHILTSDHGGVYFDLGQVVGNIALFVPLGWLLPMTWPGLRSLKSILAVAALCSAGIEMSQLLVISGRSPTIDDVILNTLGALVGAIMFFAPRAA